MPDLRKFGLGDGDDRADQPLLDATAAAAMVPAADLAEVADGFHSAPAPVTLDEPAPSTGDPVLDLVLQRRRAARERIRALRAELAQERRRLADITAFMRPHTSQRDTDGQRASDTVEAQ